MHAPAQPATEGPARRRRADWAARLADFLRAREGRAFAWGQQDCALLACDAVQAMCGLDAAAPFRGTYGTWWGAQRRMIEWLRRQPQRVVTGKSLLELVAEAVAAECGLEEVGAEAAAAGDVALCRARVTERDTGEVVSVALGVVDGDGQMVVIASTWGLARVLRASIVRAWRV